MPFATLTAAEEALISYLRAEGIDPYIVMSRAFFEDEGGARDPKRVQAFFDRLGGGYESLRPILGLLVGPGEEERLYAIQQRLTMEPDDLILDIGVGTGFVASGLLTKLRGGKIVGVDISSTMLRIVRKAYSSEPPDGRLLIVQADACSLPFKDNSFDKVSSGYVLDYVRDEERALLEMCRVLKKGGKFALVTVVRRRENAVMGETMKATIDRWNGILQSASPTKLDIHELSDSNLGRSIMISGTI